MRGRSPAVLCVLDSWGYPDAGEVIGGPLEKTPSTTTGIAPSSGDLLVLDPAVYAADFAAELPKAKAGFMALPWAAEKAFGAPINMPAGKDKATSAIVATHD